ncbi:phospholipase [Pigmentiphaga aceris]|uniref:Phospholipase n=1 Tax=Pigmentiphaga aceris TaxID=1940612 RepID=A0A5C0AVL0_9BURK|nr:AAA domain-containing protein [Pigmentiphaga aceris]QEI06472.1 phospholipase [Pigmentiphaga aceris]
MQARSLAYAGYWRNSLADAELGQGSFSHSASAKFLSWSRAGSPVGQVGKQIIDTCFQGEDAATQTVDVVIRHKVYRARLEHGQARQNGQPQTITPLITPALLARDGRLYPLDRTVVARDLLDPLLQGTYALGDVAALDRFLSTAHVPGVGYVAGDVSPAGAARFSAQWQDHLAACERLFSAVCPGWPAATDAYVLADESYLLKQESVSGASRHIVGLYDHLQQRGASTPLFDRYASETIDPPETCLPAHASFTSRLGHASDVYPLAVAQRDALGHALEGKHGDILAVNGPPGTGKTTLLLSVVASLWAKAALAGGEPPVIIASSTNNQAVTNIIDAFGKDFSDGSGHFAGRWLPNIASFGAYFPSQSKEAVHSKKYQTQSFFAGIETPDYVASATEHFLAHGAKVFPSLGLPGLSASMSVSVSDIVDALQQCLREEVDKLATIEKAWANLSDAKAQFAADSKQHKPQPEAGNWQREWVTLAQRYDVFRAQESLFYAIFSWIPSVAAKRLRLARVFLQSNWPAAVPQQDWRDLDQIERAIAAGVAESRRAAESEAARAAQGQAVRQRLELRQREWANALAPLGLDAEAQTLSLAAVDERADQLVRFHIFRLTTHYWEGRWLQDMHAALPTLAADAKKTGRVSLEKRWRRRMKLTPCVVSTFYMLPSMMKVSRFDAGGYVDDYLYDFADLLIVDEAGQVLPEVAGASFALAKQALVIGDTLQIEPIWSIPAHVDAGNLARAGLLPRGSDEATYERLIASGKTSAAGSVMRIAQCASRWHYDRALPRGLFLYEHRRCVDEIIAYCNALCYQGKLIPRRGDKSTILANPNAAIDEMAAMTYLHVDGICQRSSGGSRENLHEAAAIAGWLVANKATLEATYRLKLHEIVGVVTPFSAQVRAIAKACQAVDIEVGSEPGKMTVGTVHSLQGAERPVVIFSGVYSKHADGDFIDAGKSLLNVAVSRAKNTFMVFGDMDVFQLAPPSSPRGQLARLLFGHDANALQFHSRPRPDLSRDETGVMQLVDAEMHDAFLASLLANAMSEVHIVSPWIRLECVQETGALAAMQAAVQRGVAVHVYTDGDSNTSSRDESEKADKREALNEAIAAVRAVGVQVSVVLKVHNKIVIGDKNVYCVGSFNWFSARREWKMKRHEISLVYRGAALGGEIETAKRFLQEKAHPEWA